LDKFSIPMSRPDLGRKEIEAISKVFDTNWISEGIVTERFEGSLSDYIKSNCIVVNNGSSALMCSLLAHGIKPGDKVLVPAFTFVASSSIPKILGAEIVVADIDPETFNVTTETIEDVIKNNVVNFVLVVDIGGLPVDIEGIKELSKKYNFNLIEDAAQSFGAEYKNKKLGSFDHLAAFSFQIAKQLTTVEGGCIASTNETLMKKINRIKDYGRTDELYVHDIVGTNFRTTDLQSAIGIEQLKKVESNISRRIEIANRYRNELKQWDFQEIPSYVTKHSYMLFFVKAKNKEERERCVKLLTQNGIDSRRSWLPIHKQPCNPELSSKRFPQAEMIYNQIFTLPIFNGMTDEEVDKVIEIAKKL
jgi:perosamine synthetase